MPAHVWNIFLHGAIILGLFLIDFALGNGFVDMFNKIYCKITCFFVKYLREKEKQAAHLAALENPISLPILFTEILILSLTIAFLKKYKHMRGKDRIDELLKESKDSIQQTNEFLEKWRLRRINWQVPTEYTYLDEEPQELKPLKLEVPILHMAIIDARCTARNQLERGDVGNPINFTNSTLLSVTSLVDDDDSISEHYNEEKINDQTRNVDLNNRYLWNVMEEDGTNVDD